MTRYTILLLMEDSLDKLQATIDNITQATEFESLTTSISLCAGHKGGYLFVAALTYTVKKNETI